MKNRKEGRKKITRERQRKKKGKKGGCPNKAKEKQRETQINKQKLPFLGGKLGFPIKKQIMKKAKENKKKQKDKEGLGPSEVALWATSPDP